MVPSIDKGIHGFTGRKCARGGVKRLDNTEVFPAALSLPGHISAPAKLLRTCR